MQMDTDQPRLPYEILIFITDLLIHSYLYSESSKVKSQSRLAIGSLYQTNKTFNNRLIPVLFRGFKFGNCGPHLAQAGFYRQGGGHTYLAERIQTLSIHIDLPIERPGTTNEIRLKRISDFEEITRLDTFPRMPKLESVHLSSEGSTAEDLRLMLTKSISLIRPNLKYLSLDMHSIKTLFDIHALELRYEMEVAKEKIWPEGLKEITFDVGSSGIPEDLGAGFFGKAATFAFQILGGMDIVEILDQPDVKEKTTRQTSANLQANQRKQKGIFRINYGPTLFNNTAEFLKGIMRSICFRFDPEAEQLNYEQRKDLLGVSDIFNKTRCSRSSRFKVNVKGGLKVEDQMTFDTRAWLFQSEEVVLEGQIKARERTDFANPKFFETDRVGGVWS